MMKNSAEMSRNAIWKSEDFAIEKAVKEWNRLFNRVMGIKTFYMKNEEQILECREKYPLRTSYAEFVKEYQIRDNTILYEAFGGRGMLRIIPISGCLRTSRITENKLKNTKNIRTCDL